MEMEMENKLIIQKRNLLLLVKAQPLSISAVPTHLSPPISDPRPAEPPAAKAGGSKNWKAVCSTPRLDKIRHRSEETMSNTLK